MALRRSRKWEERVARLDSILEQIDEFQTWSKSSPIPRRRSSLSALPTRRATIARLPTVTKQTDFRGQCLAAMRTWIDDEESPEEVEEEQSDIRKKVEELYAQQQQQQQARRKERRRVFDLGFIKARSLLAKEPANLTLPGSVGHPELRRRFFKLKRALDGSLEHGEDAEAAREECEELLKALRAHEMATRRASRRQFAHLYADPRSLALDVDAVEAAKDAWRLRARIQRTVAEAARADVHHQRAERALSETRVARRARRLEAEAERDATRRLARQAIWLRVVAVVRAVQDSSPWGRRQRDAARSRFERALQLVRGPLMRHFHPIRVKHAKRCMHWFLENLARQRAVRDAVKSWTRKVRIAQRYWRRRLLRRYAELRICREQWDRLESNEEDQDVISKRLKARALQDIIKQVHLKNRDRFGAQKLGLFQSEHLSCMPPFPTAELVDDTVMLAWIQKTREHSRRQIRLARSIFNYL